MIFFFNNPVDLYLQFLMSSSRIGLLRQKDASVSASQDRACDDASWLPFSFCSGSLLKFEGYREIAVVPPVQAEVAVLVCMHALPWEENCVGVSVSLSTCRVSSVFDIF